MRTVKVDIPAYKNFLLHNGGIGSIDEENFQEKAELISTDGQEALIQFHRQKHFDFQYYIPVRFITF